MNYWLAQLVLAARNSNERDTGWIQILVFVILSVFYAVGSIVKAKANKTALKEEKEEEEQTSPKPARKSPESTIDLQLLKQLWRPARPGPGSQPGTQVAKPQVQPTRRKVARPQPIAQKPPTKTKISAMEPQVQPKLEEIPELTAETIKKLEGKHVAVPAETPQAEYLSEILSDYDDPEKLRRAILHYEILGKPLSLRDPLEHTIGF